MFSSVMKMFCLVLMVAVFVQESSETPLHEPRYYCGRALASIRDYLCLELEEDSQPNSASIVRRSSSTSITNTPEKTSAGIVDECCLKPCYMSDILSYC